GRPVGRLLVGAAGVVGGRPRGPAAVGRDAGRGRGGHRHAARDAAGRDHPAGRAGLHGAGGLRGPRPDRGQPAGAAPPGPVEGAGPPRGVPGLGGDLGGGAVIQEAIRCLETVEVVTEWMEGALDDAPRAAVEEHLAICPACIAYVDQLRTTTTLAARLAASDDPPPPAVKDRLLAAFRASRPA